MQDIKCSTADRHHTKINPKNRVAEDRRLLQYLAEDEATTDAENGSRNKL